MSVYMASVMAVFKPFLNYGMKSVDVSGLQFLLEVIENYAERHSTGTGLLTISNHISTLDDPMSWGIMPYRTFFNTNSVRWTLGASDILFTNRLIAPLFHSGQVIETFRGQGIHQPAIDTAIDKLNKAQWVHIFPEGRVNQDGIDPTKLLRFKWGVSRLVLEAAQPPIILPIYLKGFENVMPEDRSWPFTLLPRPFQSLKIFIGPPISPFVHLRERFRDAKEIDRVKIRIELAAQLRDQLSRLGDQEGHTKIDTSAR
ncbi:acyltransferase-domain-containing protein [Melampsora americana]|nr:acyltransferase-domain-containing protein [Melampsora americana]